MPENSATQPGHEASRAVAVRAPEPPPSPSTIFTPAPPPPPTPIAPSFGPQWPGPGRTAAPSVLLAALITALVAAALLGWDRPGVGWFVTGVVGAIAVAVVAWHHRRTGSPERETVAGAGPTSGWLMRTVWAALALTLLAAGGLRAAGWLWLLCLPVAAICGALALAGGSSLRGLAMGPVAVPIAMVRALPWVAQGLGAARGRASSSVARILAAVVVSLVLLLVFGALLANADPAFATVLDWLLPTVDGGVVGRWVWNFVLLFIGTLAACFLAIRPPTFDPEPPADAAPADAASGDSARADAAPRWSLGRIEWGVPVATLVLLFASFIAVQATVLFGGGQHVLETANLTYADYARQGFGQLAWVTVLTLLILAVAARVARRNTMVDRIWVRGLLGSLSLLTLVIVASALNRMWLYEEAYGFTRLRLVVSVCEGWLGLVFIMVLIAGIRLRGSWLPAAMVATAALALVGIVAANPDYLIAQENVARYHDSNKIDLAYLATLSPDAVPALDRLPGDLRLCVLASINDDLIELGPDEPREWNLGRHRARQILADYEPPGYGSSLCPQSRYGS